MRLSSLSSLIALLILMALPPVHRLRGDTPDAASVASEVEELSSRVFFYAESFPDAKLPSTLDSEHMDQLKVMAEKSPAQVGPLLKNLIGQLDTVALPALKAWIYRTGKDIAGSPTSDGNFQSRKRILLEFASILERKKIPIQFFFPKGRAEFFHRIEVPGEQVFKIVDQHFGMLAQQLHGEMKGSLATGGGSTGGSTDGTVEGTAGGGPSSVSWDIGGPSASPGTPRPLKEDDDVGGTTLQRISRIFAYYLLRIAGVVLVLGSLAAVCLPRLRGTVRSFLISMRSGAKPGVVVDEDAFKKVLTFVGRGDFRKALGLLDKVDEARSSQDWLYWKTLCNFRILNFNEGIRLIKLLQLDSLPPDALTRLAGVLEECRQIEWCVQLLTHLEKKDPENKAVAQKAANLRRILQQDEKARAAKGPPRKDAAEAGNAPKS